MFNNCYNFFLKFIFLSFHSFLLLNYKANIQEYLSMELLKNTRVLNYIIIYKNSSELVRNITSDVSHFSAAIMSILTLIVECLIFVGVFYVAYFSTTYKLFNYLINIYYNYNYNVHTYKKKIIKLWITPCKFLKQRE